MYKILLLIPLLTALLLANNPRPYAALGDVIYDNAKYIEKLQNIDSCQVSKVEIQKYLKDVNKTKKYGFELEAHKANRDKKVYLNRLRELSKINDDYVRRVKAGYAISMKTDNYQLFSQVINSGLIDIKEKKLEIIDYYYKHRDDINATGVIGDLLDEDAKLKARKEALRKQRKTQKELEAEKIKRIRENDRREKERLELELQRNLEKEQERIREEQKKELSN